MGMGKRETMSDLVPEQVGNELNEKRYLVIHVNHEPAQFTDASLAREYIEKLKLQGFTKPDIYQFDQQAGGWRKVEKV